MSCFISYTSSFPTCWCQGKEQKSPEWTVRMTPMQCCQSFFIMFVCEVAHQYMKLTVLSVTITSSWVCSSLHCVEFFLLFHCRLPPGAIVHGLNPLDFWAHIYKSHKNKGYNPQNLFTKSYSVCSEKAHLQTSISFLNLQYLLSMFQIQTTATHQAICSDGTGVSGSPTLLKNDILYIPG